MLSQNERSGVQLIYRLSSARQRARQRKQEQESPRRAISDGSRGQFDAGRNAKSLKQLLGELYDDHVYLMRLLGEQGAYLQDLSRLF